MRLKIAVFFDRLYHKKLPNCINLYKIDIREYLEIILTLVLFLYKYLDKTDLQFGIPLTFIKKKYC